MAISVRGLWILAAVPAAGLALSAAAQEPSKVEAGRQAAAIMDTWRAAQTPERLASWDAEARAAAPAAQQTQASAPAGPGQSTKFTARDQMLWSKEEKAFIEEGYKNFHNAKALGGTIGISCDMCHPNASNTHPETYPKFQTQTKKMALLRDMINWCIENPLKGKPLPDDDARLRSVEAYILAMRKGVPLDPGKH